mgnify:CR=1 FL=1
MNFLQLLLPDFALILLGYLVCRYTALNRTVWEQVESLVYFFLFPVLLFQSIVRSPLDLGAASSLIAAGLAMGIIAIALVSYFTQYYYKVPGDPLMQTAQIGEGARIPRISHLIPGMPDFVPLSVAFLLPVAVHGLGLPSPPEDQGGEQREQVFPAAVATPLCDGRYPKG